MARLCREALWLVLLALVPAAVCGALQLEFPAPPLAEGQVLVRTARAWGERVLWVDARSRARFEAGHIPGAVLLNEEEWESLSVPFLDAWDPDRPVVVYCDGGGCEASTEVATLLRERLRIPKVYVLKGGWPAWQHE